MNAYISRVYRLVDWNAHLQPGKVGVADRNLQDFRVGSNLQVDLTHEEYRHDDIKGACAANGRPVLHHSMLPKSLEGKFLCDSQ